MHLLVATSESGDIEHFLFDRKPVNLKAFLQSKCPEDFTEEGDGPGAFGSYLHLEWKDLEVDHD